MSEEPSVPAGYEVFHSKEYNDGPCNEGDLALETGWYWWSCQPGCLPDGDPVGPFDTWSDAVNDCREGVCDHG